MRSHGRGAFGAQEKAEALAMGLAMGWPGEEVYAKMACQREAGDKVKTKSTADAKASIEDLTVKIEDLAVVRRPLRGSSSWAWSPSGRPR